MVYQEFHEVRVSLQCIYHNGLLQENYNEIYCQYLHLKMMYIYHIVLLHKLYILNSYERNRKTFL